MIQSKRIGQNIKLFRQLLIVRDDRNDLTEYQTVVSGKASVECQTRRDRMSVCVVRLTSKLLTVRQQNRMSGNAVDKSSS